MAALILVDGRVVLARHRHGDRVHHLLPGGGVEPGESLADALIREVAEETGLAVTLGPLLFVSDTIDPRGARNVLNVVFLANVSGGGITGEPADPRVEAVDLVAPGDLAGLDLRPPMAELLAGAIAAGLSGPARYLGPLWVDDPAG